nr:hypothetical protein [Tanacetum cinerariifolium]
VDAESRAVDPQCHGPGSVQHPGRRGHGRHRRPVGLALQGRQRRHRSPDDGLSTALGTGSPPGAHV